MYLLLDLSIRDELHVALFDAERAFHHREIGRNRQLLSFIEQCLKEYHLRPNDILGIAVVMGTPGFTSSRIATVIANVFSYLNHIPLLAVRGEDTINVSSLVPLLRAQPPGRYLSAAYSGEPHIGT